MSYYLEVYFVEIVEKMALETLSSNELLNFVIYDTISGTPYSSHDSLVTKCSLENSFSYQEQASSALNCLSMMTPQCHSTGAETVDRRPNLAAQGRKKRRRKARVCKDKEEAETQRMTHIAVERNRRKQMNEHLAVLRSLMPESYVHRGDQASIVGGAIEFVKELEHLLQTLEAQKLRVLHQVRPADANELETTNSILLSPPFPQFFMYPQYTWSQIPNKYTSKTKASIADIEVTLIETHANLRILSRKGPRLLSKIVTGFESLYLSILHLNVITVDPLVLYSISAKVEEGCQLSSVDDIAGAVHHMLGIIEEDATALC
ncbi:transcription factor bHLH71-like [Durio zibethinus]|uniref:Transcription factor bHLH71-like n=1 Tax=Durio zibethinus TaxID=66656 RepID=A0A6P5ZU63_DURZI|nr:transcription factor bHLH71-like [Durio zibethinus]